MVTGTDSPNNPFLTSTSSGVPNTTTLPSSESESEMQMGDAPGAVAAACARNVRTGGAGA